MKLTITVPNADQRRPGKLQQHFQEVVAMLRADFEASLHSNPQEFRYDVDVDVADDSTEITRCA